MTIGGWLVFLISAAAIWFFTWLLGQNIYPKKKRARICTTVPTAISVVLLLCMV